MCVQCRHSGCRKEGPCLKAEGGAWTLVSFPGSEARAGAPEGGGPALTPSWSSLGRKAEAGASPSEASPSLGCEALIRMYMGPDEDKDVDDDSDGGFSSSGTTEDSVHR